jgi:dihydropteroate synthase
VHQELALEGGEAVLSTSAETTDLLLLATTQHLQRLIARLRIPLRPDLLALADKLEAALARTEGRPPPLTLTPLAGGEGGGSATTFDWGTRTYVMGILNVTPDSFSGDGLAGNVDAAVAQALQFVEDGADLLDVGGESTRPGSQPIDADEELIRVLPVVETLAKQTSVPISIDTYKARVAEAALDAGASLVNDVWGLRMDAAMAGLVARREVPIIVMHNRSKPKDAAQSERLGGRYLGVEYRDLLGDIVRELRESLNLALEAGVATSRIIIDPGIGFGKTVEQNRILIDRLDELRVLGCPILVGPSRKSFIGYTLDLPPAERLEGTAAAVALSIVRGADIVRVHDVKAMVRVAKMTDAMVRHPLTV